MNGSAQAYAATSAPLPAARGRRDPLALILGSGERWDLITVAMGVAVALHVAMLVVAIIGGLLKDIHLAVEENRSRLHDFFWRQYEVEVEKPKEKEPEPPPPPEPAPPEPAPAPAPKAQVKPVEDDPYKNVAPTPAQAAKVLTAAPKEDEPVDLGNTIVSGDGTALGGMQSAAGKGDQVVLNKAASNQGTPGGRGTSTAAPPAPPPGPDLSRAVALAGGGSWNCPFPPEADADQIDNAVVAVQVTVRPDGSALSASVVSDPGHGFGRAARVCALGKKYQSALNRAGEAIVGSALVNVRFSR